MTIKKKLSLAFGLLFFIIGGIIVLNQIVAKQAKDRYETIHDEIQPAIKVIDKYIQINKTLKDLLEDKIDENKGVNSTLNNKITAILEVEIPNINRTLKGVINEESQLIDVEWVLTNSNKAVKSSEMVIKTLVNKMDYADPVKLKKIKKLYRVEIKKTINLINRRLYHSTEEYKQVNFELNQELNNSFSQISIIILGFGMVGILIGLFFANQTIRSIISPINELKKSAAIVGDGNYSHTTIIEGKDEISELGNSFNIMTDSLRESFEIIQEQKEIQEESNYIKSSKNTLYEMLKGELSTSQIAKRTLEFLLEFYKAPMGSVHSITSDDHLVCEAVFAYDKKKEEMPLIPIGQGVIGAAVLNKKTVIIDDVPNEYSTINTTLGGLKAKCIVVIPVEFANECIAVIELACLNKPDEFSLSFIHEIKESIGISINAAQGLKQLEETYEKLEASSQDLALKNKELEQFVYITSHDLQEPLRTITSYSNILEEDYADVLDEDALKYVSFLQKASDRLRNQIHSLLELSRIGGMKEKEKVNFNTIFENLQTELDFLIKEKKGSLITPSFVVESIMGTSTEIQLLFQNLIVNGFKYNNNETPQVEISYMNNGTHLSFCVTDNGTGIKEKYYEKIFQIFQRLDKGEGSGIGLAHCKKIVESHNGKIWVDSEFGKGTSFFVDLKV